MIVDLGTGDGRAARALADAEPGSLVIGMDADAVSMAETSRRAAKPATRGGRPNLLFVVAPAEAPPVELVGRADEVHILFPWGSLLRGVLGRDSRVQAGIARLTRPGARITALVSVTPADGVEGLAALDDAALHNIAVAFSGTGLRFLAASRAESDEVRATRSTWGRRLVGGNAGRTVWRLTFVKDPVRAAEAIPSDGSLRTAEV